MTLTDGDYREAAGEILHTLENSLQELKVFAWAIEKFGYEILEGIEAITLRTLPKNFHANYTEHRVRETSGLIFTATKAQTEMEDSLLKLHEDGLSFYTLEQIHNIPAETLLKYARNAEKRRNKK